MIQQRLKPLSIKRERPDYPQVNYVDDRGVQWIELNRGCKRLCRFCWADPNYKVFDIPRIIRNKVQIIGENVMFDPNIEKKLKKLSEIKVNNKVVYYGLGNGFDYRRVTPEIAKLARAARIGNINNKGNWYKGVNLAWDLGINQEYKVKKALNYFLNVGYYANRSKIFILVNWEITLKECLYKFEKIKAMGLR